MYDDIVQSRDAALTNITGIIGTFLYQYLKKTMSNVELHHTKSKYKHFQRALASVEPGSKEYRRFLKWCLKKDYNEDMLQEWFTVFMNTSIQLMCSTAIEYTQVCPTIELNTVFDKCLKTVFRTYYDSPQQAIDMLHVQNILRTVLHSYLPIDCLYQERDDTFTNSDVLSDDVPEAKTEVSDHDVQLEYVPTEEIEAYNVPSKSPTQSDTISDNVREIQLGNKQMYNKHKK